MDMEKKGNESTMKSKRLAAAAAALIVTVSALGSCGSNIKSGSNDSSSIPDNVSAVTEIGGTSSEGDTVSGVDIAYDEDGEPAETEAPVIRYDETDFDAIEVPYIEYSKTYQAESGTFVGNTSAVLKDRASFKGDGYVAGAAPDNWSLTFDLPVSQFYNITVMTASDRALNSTLSVNGHDVWVFRTEGTGSFAEKQLVNIWLNEGINEIRLSSTDNAVDIDYITIEANKEISMLSPDLSKSALSNANATWRAEALYQLLCSDYGKQVITAQHDTAGGSAETDAVYQVTGKYPAIRVSDLGGYTKGNPKDITQAFEYWDKGGIIAYDWYWVDPAGKKSSIDYDIANVNFDVRKAVPKTVEVQVEEQPEDTSSADDSVAGEEDEYDEWGNPIERETPAPTVRTERRLEFTTDEMSMWTPDEVEQMHEDKKITDECYYILKDIDTASKHLTKLFDENIPVLWRPLPAASNGLYWWGLDKDSYKWLWELMYKRMTNYHGLNNLVWVWSAQNAEWYVGDDLCDVISADVYTNGSRDAQINTMLSLNNICTSKPIAMTECGNLPSMDSMLREKAMWSYTALWTEPYLAEELGLSANSTEATEAAEERIRVYYNNNYTLTLDELPSIPDVAKAIRDEAKKDGRAKTKTKDKGSDRAEEGDGYSEEEESTDSEQTEEYTDDGGYTYDDGTGYTDYGYTDYGYTDYGYTDYGTGEYYW